MLVQLMKRALLPDDRNLPLVGYLRQNLVIHGWLHHGKTCHGETRSGRLSDSLGPPIACHEVRLLVFEGDRDGGLRVYIFLSELCVLNDFQKLTEFL